MGRIEIELAESVGSHASGVERSARANPSRLRNRELLLRRAGTARFTAPRVGDSHGSRGYRHIVFSRERAARRQAVAVHLARDRARSRRAHQAGERMAGQPRRAGSDDSPRDAPGSPRSTISAKSPAASGPADRIRQSRSAPDCRAASTSPVAAYPDDAVAAARSCSSISTVSRSSRASQEKVREIAALLSAISAAFPVDAGAVRPLAAAGAAGPSHRNCEWCSTGGSCCASPKRSRAPLATPAARLAGGPGPDPLESHTIAEATAPGSVASVDGRKKPRRAGGTFPQATRTQPSARGTGHARDPREGRDAADDGHGRRGSVRRGRGGFPISAV